MRRFRPRRNISQPLHFAAMNRLLFGDNLEWLTARNIKQIVHQLDQKCRDVEV